MVGRPGNFGRQLLADAYGLAERRLRLLRFLEPNQLHADEKLFLRQFLAELRSAAILGDQLLINSQSLAVELIRFFQPLGGLEQEGQSGVGSGHTFLVLEHIGELLRQLLVNRQRIAEERLRFLRMARIQQVRTQIGLALRQGYAVLDLLGRGDQ